MRVRIDPERNFKDEVFGASSFIEYFPDLLTDLGVEIRDKDSNGIWYIWNEAKNREFHDSAFFYTEDLKHLIILSELNDERTN